jgi:hypothetical protein
MDLAAGFAFALCWAADRQVLTGGGPFPYLQTGAIPAASGAGYGTYGILDFTLTAHLFIELDRLCAGRV